MDHGAAVVLEAGGVADQAEGGHLARDADVARLGLGLQGPGRGVEQPLRPLRGGEVVAEEQRHCLLLLNCQVLEIIWIFHEVPVFSVHLQEAPEILPERPCGQQSHQFCTDICIE